MHENNPKNNVNYVISSINPIKILNSFEDTENYNYVMINSASECFQKYIGIIIEYNTRFVNSPSLVKMYTNNQTFYYYLLDKGVATITHIFKIILFTTKNLKMAEHYGRQSIEYYTEFLVQNSRGEENNKIDYNNASKFSYEKTIYKLQKCFKKTALSELNEHTAEILCLVEEKETYLFKNVDILIELHKLLWEQERSLEKVSIHNILSLNNNHDQEQVFTYKLTLLLEFMKMSSLHKVYLDCLCGQLENISPAYLPTPEHLIKKLLSRENKLKLARDTKEDYVKWLLL
jgi:hypothetical protein